jgi:hypothetical protein
MTLCGSSGSSEASAVASVCRSSRSSEKQTLKPSVVDSVIMPVLGSEDRSTVQGQRIGISQRIVSVARPERFVDQIGKRHGKRANLV